MSIYNSSEEVDDNEKTSIKNNFNRHILHSKLLACSRFLDSLADSLHGEVTHGHCLKKK